MKRKSLVINTVLLALWIGGASAMPASAHLHEQVGDVVFTVGWSSEPAFSGEPNTVQVFVNEAAAGGEEGPPVAARQVKLTVEIIFGERSGTEKLPAVPLESFAFGSPGEFRTEAIVPTRPGTYTFHFVGTIKGNAFDKYYTSGEKGAIEGTQYNDVGEVAKVSFPEKDPTNGQLALAVDNARKTASAAADKASDDAKNARLFGIIGIIVGVIGLAVGVRPRGKKAAS
jgi:hypothetical protein